MTDLEITIHQANYLPYPGFFHKVSNADKFVIMDDVQFQYDVNNRNKIITPDGDWTRIIVPFKKNQKFFKIKDVEIDNDFSWKEENYNLISKSYKNSPNFSKYNDFLKSIFEKDWNNMFELNFQTIKQTLKLLGIKTEIILESELNIKGESTTRLINVCKALDADGYLSGPGGKNYLETEMFQKNNINLKFNDYVINTYPQLFSKSFVPNLSIIDLIMNMGDKSMEIIKNSS